MPPDRPSDLALTRQLPPKDAGDEDEAATAHSVKAVTADDAQRVLEARSPRPPPVVGAVARPAPRPGMPTKRPPSTHNMFSGIGTQPGVAPQPGVSVKGRATLLLDSSAPPVQADASVETPPIVVPSSTSGATQPKAVTQPPPWGEGAMHAGPAIPKGMPPQREREPSIEEISGSLLLADASGEATAAQVEELSGSVLLEDPSNDKGPILKKPPVPSSRPPGRPSVKPPVPKSSKPPPAAHMALLGMPELPKATPAPRMDLLPPLSQPRQPAAAPSVIVAEPALEATPGLPPPDAMPGAEPDPAQVPQSSAPPPPPPQMTGDIELTRLPRGGLQPLFDVLAKVAEQARALIAKGADASAASGRPPWFLPAVIVAGLIVGIGLMGLVVSLARPRPERASTASPTRTSSTASAPTPTVTPAPTAAATTTDSTATAAATAAATTTATAPAAPAPRSTSACTVLGIPHVIAPSATVAAGVEVVRLGDDLALGFAPSEHEAIAVRVDATSLEASARARAHSKDPIRRVTPVRGGNAKGSLSLVADADRRNERLQGRRTVVAEPPLQVGASAGHLSWSRQGGASGDLWPLDEGSGIESLRGVADLASNDPIALAFRRGSAVWTGVATGGASLATKGDLSHVDGLGTAVGSPTVAINDGVVLLAWADRASTDDPWRLRWVRFAAGEAPGMPNAFSPPAGGKGEQAMSPSVAALPGGRFLLLWTEGPASGHDLRGLTLDSDGKPLGGPLTLSSPGVNAGQGQAAVNATGSGVVAFLESASAGFEVAATSITCKP